MGKKGIRFYAAITIGKSAYLLQKLLKMNASYFPGKLAIKMCPDFMEHMEKTKTIIAVTGTNGKTTVCNMLNDILEDNGYKVLNNRFGSNVNAGIASSLIAGSNILGKTKKEISVFEVDERSSRLIYPYIKPNYIICTNLFRDSVRRNANAEYIFNFINNNIPSTSHLILNADDTISSNLGQNNSKTYYSVSRLPSDVDKCVNLINDGRLCPKCHGHLTYEYVRYHHIGKATCDKCGFKSPIPDYLATPDFNNRQISIQTPTGVEEYPLLNDSIFNIYNEVTVVSVLRNIGISYEKLLESISKIKIVKSRYTKITVEGLDLVTCVAKGQNPIACSRVFDYISKEPGKKEVVLILDDVFDRKDTSENMSWIWDADFEFLNSDDISNIVISGVRCEDYKMRLLFAGVPEEKLQETTDEENSYKLLKLDGTNAVYFLHDIYSDITAAKSRDGLIKKLKEGNEK